MTFEHQFFSLLQAPQRVWPLVLCAALLTTACESVEDKELRERQQRYADMTGLPAGSVINVVQKGFSAGIGAQFWVYYFEDRLSLAELKNAPAVICKTQRQSGVTTSNNEPLSEALQRNQPTLKKLFIRCEN